MARHSRKQTRKVNGGKYHWELQEWVNKLFLEYPTKCIVCGSHSHLEPHHILPVKPYNELYASVSNGCLICKDCHHEYHSLYGKDITPFTLMEYSKMKNKCNKKKNPNKQLKKKYNQLKLVEKYYRNETERLRKILEDNNIEY